MSDRTGTELPAVPRLRDRVVGAVLLLGAFTGAVRAAGEMTGGDPRTAAAAAGVALSLLLAGLAVSGWRTGLCVRAAWLFPATLTFTGLAMLADTDYGSADPELLGPVLVAAGLAGWVLYGGTLARLREPAARTAGRTGAEPQPWMRALGTLLLLGAAYFAVQLVNAAVDGDWRRLVAAVGYGTALFLGGLGLNGRQVRLSLRLAWLFPATLAFLGLTMIMDPDYGDPTWSGAAAVGSAVVHVGSAMMVAGLLGFAVYASALTGTPAGRPPRHR
ncbi:hypothetical protein [Actinomadura sp. WMMB 499]|uniref:hypothetical protein n=1 Tax=Actinomadura sp. WMMB 499 TaxID=1219491 RepID=UPI00124592A8|nr:hypothetical protein [Actinomadura sp. WMMB 499]QFG21546.1 hypothetical protein F7P10_10790 [Actinomadura sp. WMMB 499]